MAILFQLPFISPGALLELAEQLCLAGRGAAVTRFDPQGTPAPAKVNAGQLTTLALRWGGHPPVDPRQEVAAGALAGQRRDLEYLLTAANLEEFAAHHRLAAALALVCRRAAVHPYPAAFDRELYWATGRHLLLNEEMRKAGQALGDAGIPWVTIKGADLAGRVYAHPCERTLTDVDIVVKRNDLGRTLACLGNLGWLQEDQRHLDPAALLGGERYVLTVGASSGVLVELHYRLWGWMPAAMGDALVDGAEPRPDWGVTARRPTLAWAFLLAAVHAWQVVRPRPLAVWRDLSVIATAAGPELADGVVRLATTWSVQLPVALAAWQAARLWPDPSCAHIAWRLVAHLRSAEVLAASRFAHRGEDGTPLALLVLARLLARRPSRLGWRSVGQVFWPADGPQAALAPAGSPTLTRLAATWSRVQRSVRQ